MGKGVLLRKNAFFWALPKLPPCSPPPSLQHGQLVELFWVVVGASIASSEL